MRLRISKISLMLALLVGPIGLAVAADPFQIGISPVFQGDLPLNEIVPLQVIIQNTGPDARGALRIASNSDEVSYPIELPRGANKRITVYPNIEYGDLTINLDTDQGDIHRNYAVPGNRSEGMHVLLLSDVPGELAFIRDLKDASSTGSSIAGGPPGSQSVLSLLDCYAKPEDAPNRSVGYDGISSIILGTGSERLTDDVVEAIKVWLTSGRSLVFIGGASAPILADPRWAGLLPARNFHVASLNGSQVLSGLGGMAAPPVSITTGSLVEGASGRLEDGLLITADRPFGLGKVTYCSFNPFESPLNKWDGRRPVMTKLLRVTENLAADKFLASYDSDRPANTTTSTIPVSSASVVGSYSILQDPFSTKLPPVGKMFTILVCYFIAVVPINFLVLKKLKRGELAWFTAPIISLGFAGVLFTAAGSLYHARMSTVSNGIIFAQEGNHNGVFAGTSQMFIPRGGTYDLKLSGIDSLQAESTDEYSYDRRRESSNFEAVDVGEWKVPNLVADNLSFRRISYRQLIPVSSWFHVLLKPTSSRAARCEVSNVGPYMLKDVSLVVGSNSISIGNLGPGDRHALDVAFNPRDTVNDLAVNDVRVFTLRKERAVLTGSLIGFRPGPQLGDEIHERSSVKMFLFSDWEARR